MEGLREPPVSGCIRQASLEIRVIKFMAVYPRFWVRCNWPDERVF